MKQFLSGLLPILTAIAAAAWGILAMEPPEVVPADGPAAAFSAARARRHLDQIARLPHAIGTEEHARVRQRIVGAIEALGVEAVIQEATAVTQRRSGRVVAGRVRNVMARLDGRDGSRAVLLVSHYDTVPTSPGAGDDGAAVAAMLETLRALAQGPTLARDVVFLFTDGEEAGLLGARAFIEEHPWADGVEVVINLEARGTRGPAVLFETSAGNRRLIRSLARSAARPVAVSFSQEIYRLLPNETDFDVFQRAGLRGLNLAFIHGAGGYHNARDDLEHLDLRSVQHLGESALALTRHFADAALAPEAAPPSSDAVYFNLPGGILVAYPGVLAPPLTVLLALAAFGVAWLGTRRQSASPGGLALALVAVVAATGAIGLLFHLAGGLLLELGSELTLWGGRSSTALQLLAVALVAAGLAAAIASGLRRRLGAGNLVGGGLLCWALFTLVVSASMPGASYLFGLPLALALAAAGFWIAAGTGGSAQEESPTPALLLVLALTAGATALLWAPALALIAAAALGNLAAVVTGAAVALLLLGPLAAHLHAAPRGAALPMAAVALGLMLAAGVRLTAVPDAANPRSDTLFYGLDTETGDAAWLSFDRAPDGWTSRRLGENPQRGHHPAFVASRRPILVAPAPAIPLGGARIRSLGASESGDARALELEISWPFDVHHATVLLRSEGDIRAISLAGRRLERGRNVGAGEAASRMALAYFAPPASGIRLTVELAGDEPLQIETVGQRYELPRLDGARIEPRPAHLIPGSFWMTDSTLVRSVATIPR